MKSHWGIQVFVLFCFVCLPVYLPERGTKRAVEEQATLPQHEKRSCHSPFSSIFPSIQDLDYTCIMPGVFLKPLGPGLKPQVSYVGSGCFNQQAMEPPHLEEEFLCTETVLWLICCARSPTLVILTNFQSVQTWDLYFYCFQFYYSLYYRHNQNPNHNGWTQQLFQKQTTYHGFWGTEWLCSTLTLRDPGWLSLHYLVTVRTGTEGFSGTNERWKEYQRSLWCQLNVLVSKYYLLTTIVITGTVRKHRSNVPVCHGEVKNVRVDMNILYLIIWTDTKKQVLNDRIWFTAFSTSAFCLLLKSTFNRRCIDQEGSLTWTIIPLGNWECRAWGVHKWLKVNANFINLFMSLFWVKKQQFSKAHPKVGNHCSWSNLTNIVFTITLISVNSTIYYFSKHEELKSQNHPEFFLLCFQHLIRCQNAKFFLFPICYLSFPHHYYLLPPS